MARRAQLSRTCSYTPKPSVLWCAYGRGRGARWVGWQRPALDRLAFAGTAHRWTLAVDAHGFLPRLCYGLLCLGPGIVVSNLDTDLSSIFALAVQRVPVVALSSARCDDGLEVGPRLPNQLCFLVIVEDGDFEAVVVGRVVDGEA
jgi:hypothetical protein